MRRHHCWLDSGEEMNEDDLKRPAATIEGGTAMAAAEAFAFDEAPTCDNTVDVIVMNVDTREFSVVTCKARWQATASRSTTRAELMGVS